MTSIVCRPQRPYRTAEAYALTCPAGHEVEIPCAQVIAGVGACPRCSAVVLIVWRPEVRV